MQIGLMKQENLFKRKRETKNSANFNFSITKTTFFPSVSSVKTMLSPFEYINILTRLREIYPYFLISAYDLAYSNSEVNTVNSILDDAIMNGNIILLDSGNYESFWKSSPWFPKDYHSVLEKFPYSMAFSFVNQNPIKNINRHFHELVENYQKDKVYSKNKVLIPIIHSPQKDISALCKKVALETGSPIIAVPERILGNGIFERAKAVEKIRLSLDENDCYTRLHLLGTGNPISIGIYTIMGADSFDGLEWYQTVVDNCTANLYHFSHADFFIDNNEFIDTQLPYILKTLTNKLIFYSKWMKGLQDAFMAGTLLEFCELKFSDKIFRNCYENLDWRKFL